MAPKIVSFRKRFPKRQEIVTLFLVCVFPTHVWSLIAFLREIPSYVMRLDIGEIAGVFAYTQSFILFETFLILLCVIALACLLPRQLILDRFVSQGAILVLVTSFWVIPVHYQERIVSKLSLNVTNYLIFIFILALTYMVSMFGLSIILRRYPRFESGFQSFVDRLVVLSAIYGLLDLASLFIVIYRNIINTLP